VPRRLAAALIAVASAAAALAVTGEAATFGFSPGVHDIDHGIHCTGGVCTMQFWVPARRTYYREPAGTFLMHDTATGASVLAYCTDIADDLRYDATFNDGPQTSDVLTYILNNYYPVRPPVLQEDHEAAAVQISVWAVADGVPLDGPLAPRGVPTDVLARAKAIFGDATSHAEQPVPDALTVTFTGAAPVLPADDHRAFTVRVLHPDGSPAVGLQVSVTTDGGTLGGSAEAATLVTGADGTAGGNVYRSDPGVATVTARATAPVAAGRALIPSIQPSQRLVLASQFPFTSTASASTPFTGVPIPQIAKTVRDIESGASGAQIVSAPGHHLVYTVAVHNAGAVATQDSVVTDDLSGSHGSHLDLLADLRASGGLAATVSNRVAAWHIGPLAPGDSVSLTLTGVLSDALDDPQDALCNVAVLNAGDLLESNQACAVLSSTAAVVTSKLVDGVTSNSFAGDGLGAVLHYTIAVTNAGTRNLPDLEVKDPLGTGSLRLLTDVQPAGGIDGRWDAVTRVMSWHLDVPVGHRTNVGFDARVPANLPHGVSTCFTIIAAVEGSGVSASTNSTVTCVRPDVCPTYDPVVSVTGPSQLPAQPGDATYEVIARDVGATSLDDATVTVTLPAGARLSDSVPPAPVVSGSTAVFHLGTMAPGSERVLDLRVLIPKDVAEPFRVVAQLAAAGTADTPGCPGAQAASQADMTSSAPPPPPPGPGPWIPVPHAGAGPEVFRSLLVGGGLIVAGLTLITGIRRNPYRREAGHLGA